MPLYLDTNNLLGKYVLVYGYHLIDNEKEMGFGDSSDFEFEYLYDTTLPITDYLSKEKRQEMKVIALGCGIHKISFQDTTITISVYDKMHESVKQIRHNEVIKFMYLTSSDGERKRLIEFVERAKSYCIDYLENMSNSNRTIKKYLYECHHGGDWELMHTSPARVLESVFLPTDEKKRIQEFVDKCNSKEVRDEYSKFNIPYKFNLLLHGVSGSGKSSTIHAIASELNSDIAILSFSSEITDNHLIKAMSRLIQLENCKVVVMEDIDCLFSSNRKENDTARNSVSLSGLLNILDGVSRAEGLVVCMTTNNVEVLDHAMLRAGRIDAMIKYTYADPDQVREMIKFYFGDKVSQKIVNEFNESIQYKNITTSMLQQYFFDLRSTPERIVKDIKKMHDISNKDELTNDLPSMYM